MRTFRMRSQRPENDLDLASDLNEQQRSVVESPGGPMLVVAGAGSGKTRTVTYRLARLIRDGCPPDRILLVTFTNRAAREMRHRVETLVRADARTLWCGTFHHVANRLLREHGAAIGLGPEFSILDREDAGDLLASCMVDEGIDVGARRFPKRAVLQSIASLCASNLVDVESLLADRHPTFLGLAGAIERVLARYARRKRQLMLTDYDDLLAAWLELLERHAPEAEAMAGRFDHVLVDEYQDTNAIQGRIVERMAQPHRNVCVVGDDCQAIYGFRGAAPETMLAFRDRFPDCVVHRLETNYRSTPEIIALANASIAHNERCVPKTLRAERPAGLRPAVVPCGDHFVQARFLAEYVLHLQDEGRCLSEIAVLYRSHWHALEIELEFERRDIPYAIRGGLRFFEQAHVKDLVAFLRLCLNPRDELAWLRVLRLVPRIGNVAARKVHDHVTTLPDPLAAAAGDDAALALLPHAARGPYESFRGNLQGLGPDADPATTMTAIVERYYGHYLDAHFANAAARRQDLAGVTEFAAQYRTVESFLSDVVLAGEFDGETCVDGPEEQLFVTLSTVHQAKGLEWPVVMVPWVADGRFPTDMAMGTPEELEEERRVFHVALTRARDEVYLCVPQVWSNAGDRGDGGRRVLMKPSRFITELGPTDLYETMRLEEDLPEVTAGAPRAQASAQPVPGVAVVTEVKAMPEGGKAGRLETVQAEPARVEPLQPEPLQSEPLQPEPLQPEPLQFEPRPARPDA